MNSSEPDITRTINYYKDIYQNQCYLEFFFTSISDGDTQKTLNIYLWRSPRGIVSTSLEVISMTSCLKKNLKCKHNIFFNLPTDERFHYKLMYIWSFCLILQVIKWEVNGPHHSLTVVSSHDKEEYENLSSVKHSVLLFKKKTKKLLHLARPSSK